MQEEEKYSIKLENFEGPLDLLMHLIEKNEIDIYDIPIARVTDQYIDFIYQAEDFDLDFASEFLVLAATLLRIKAKMLLPKPEILSNTEDSEDPREELVARLLEYRLYKEIAGLLHNKETKMSKIFTRVNDELKLCKDFAPDNPVENITIYNLVEAFKVILQKANEIEPSLEIVKEEITIQECMSNIIDILKIKSDGMTFYEFFPQNAAKARIVITFLSILELIKMRKISIRQKEPFAKLIVFLRNTEE